MVGILLPEKMETKEETNSMENTKYYRKLRRAAVRKNKSEVEVYRCVSDCVNSILKDAEEKDKIMLLKSLIAYFEGMSENAWCFTIVQIVYALIIGAVGIVVPLLKEDKIMVILLAGALYVPALIIGRFANNNPDFEKKMVICVLNDKLEEYMNVLETLEIDIKVTDIDIMNKKIKKKNKKHKKMR